MPLPWAWSRTSASSAAAAARSKARSVTRNTDQLVYRINSFRSRALSRCLSSLPAAVSVIVKSLVTPNERSLRPSRPAATSARAARSASCCYQSGEWTAAGGERAVGKVLDPVAMGCPRRGGWQGSLAPAGGGDALVAAGRQVCGYLGDGGFCGCDARGDAYPVVGGA